ncbi:MAG: hypothetical protein WAM85_14075 [Terracidiphilus sp.]
MNQVVYSSGDVLKRTMVKDILAAIDSEIATLEQAKALLSASGEVVARRKPGRPAKATTVVVPKIQKTRRRRKMSAGAHPAGADQALGRVERDQGEHERYGCATS